MSIFLTQKAAAYLISFLKKSGKSAELRLDVKKSGCSGMSYVVKYLDKIKDTDLVFEDKGIKIIVDSKNIKYLNGLELDFVKNGLNKSLKFNNPNIKEKCGCGLSFNI
ncbi:MAG: iron-sulfur cluster assembly accessory protein [Arsenophonus sp.]|nr:MAG: iron-sulfur cluster assembly accessory protein [Arsenophonus sp.]